MSSDDEINSIIKSYEDNYEYYSSWETYVDDLKKTIKYANISFPTAERSWHTWYQIKKGHSRSRPLSFYRTLKEILDKLPEARKNFVMMDKTMNSLNIRVEKETSELFFDLLGEKLFEKLHSSKNEYRKPEHFFANRHKVVISDALRFLLAFPTTLFAVLDESWSESYVSDILPITTDPSLKLYDEEDLKRKDEKELLKLINNGQITDKFYNDIFCKPLKDFKGYVLGHSVSAYTDNFTLFCELGRFARFCRIFNQHKKPVSIILTNHDWAMLNKSILQLRSQGVNVEENLANCRTFREKLYAQVLPDALIDSRGNENLTEGTNLTYVSIQQQAKDLANIAKLLEESFGITIQNADYSEEPNSINKRNEEKSRAKILREKIFNVRTHKGTFNQLIDSFVPKLEILKIDEQARDNYLYTIEFSLQYFHSISEETFLYILHQRYSQIKYNKHLKLGVKSEIGFDHSFNMMNHIDKRTPNHELHTLYFKHYFYGQTDVTSVIPYYAYGGGIINTFPNLFDACDNALLIFDNELDEGKEKIKRILNSTSFPQIAIQISDYLSFLDYFFHDDEEGKKIKALLNNISVEAGDSWDKGRRKENKVFEDFENYVFSMWGKEKITIPYYYFPYIFHLKGLNDSSFQEKLIEFYTDFIYETLQLIHQKIGVSNYNLLNNIC